jgi:probable ATP-dependent RNA helicase DDX4
MWIAQITYFSPEFLAEKYLFLTIGIVGCASADVTQSFCEVEKFAKRDKLTEIIKEAGTERVLVFVETKKNADFIATFLSGEGFPTTSIHGDRLQREREEALR